MADNDFKPTEQEIEFLKAKRAAEEANKFDLNDIKAGMSKEDRQKAMDKIRAVWK
jgi:hypothetical protein